MLDEILGGLRLLKINMTNMLEPVRDALSGSGSAVLAQVGAGMAASVSAQESWSQIKRAQRRRGGMLDALNAEELRLLDRLFEHLGESGREAQEVLIRGALDALEPCAEAARHTAVEADRLYLTLGVLIGLMLALIIA